MNHEGISKPFVAQHTLFSRDSNYLRDAALFWPFLLFSWVGIGSVYSHQNRQLGVRSLGVAILAFLLAKEKLFLLHAALGFVALQSVIALGLHPWNWSVFAVGLLTGIPWIVAYRYWRRPKLAWELPKEFGAVDMLWAFGSLCFGFLVLYLISPDKF